MSARYEEVLCPPMQAHTCIIGNVLMLKKAHRHSLEHAKSDPFEAIAMMPADVIADMIDNVRFDDLIIALAGANENVKNAIYSAMPSTLRNIAGILIEKVCDSTIPAENIKKSRQAVIDALLA